MSNVESRYFDDGYLSENPEWDRKDALWKANQVLLMLSKNQIKPLSLCEVGCGSGDILVNLLKSLTSTKMTGFDISPQVERFWEEHKGISEIEFYLGDFHKINNSKYDLLLMLDVIEHLSDPFVFLENSRACANYFIFHIPLDLSASSVARGTPLIQSRNKVGHLHYYTKDLALATIQETGYKILDWCYTGAYSNSPTRSFKTQLAFFPRQFLYSLNKDFGVRLLGGETLVVLAKST
jgi:Methyltransferase domain